MKKINKYKNVCIVDTVYALLLYLLYIDEGDIKNTFFYFGNGIPKGIRDKLSNHYFFDRKKLLNRFFIWPFITLRMRTIFSWKFLKSSKIYAQDQLCFSYFIIGNRKYTYIEDAPYIFSLFVKSKLYKDMNLYWNTNVKIKQLLNIIIGKTFKKYAANNKLCTDVIITDNYTLPPYLIDKNIIIMPIREKWETSTQCKKNAILSIFDITKEDVNILSKKKSILFTQQFSVDHIITKEEQIFLYKNIMEKIDHSDLIIKPHPRDDINYKEIFNDVFVFDKIVPFQLLDLIGCQFNRAITISSSAVISIPYKINIDWIGNSIHPNIEKAMGNIRIEDYINENNNNNK